MDALSPGGRTGWIIDRGGDKAEPPLQERSIAAIYTLFSIPHKS